MTLRAGDSPGGHEPLVSVIILVRNGERYLASAIRSALKQDYRAFEVLVIDGQSTDRSASIARSFDGIRYVYQHGALGIAHGKNLGIDAARGELIAYMASDDLWAPSKLSLQVGCLRQPEVQYAITRVKFFLQPGCPTPPGSWRELLNGDYVAPVPETLLACRSLFDRIGRFDPALEPYDHVDWFARARDSRIPVAVVPRVLLYKRVHDGNVSLSATAPHRQILTALRLSVHRKATASRPPCGA